MDQRTLLQLAKTHGTPLIVVDHKVLRQNLAIARGFRPMAPAEIEALVARCAAAAGDGHLELYKSTMLYDGDVGRAQHGLPSHRELPL